MITAMRALLIPAVLAATFVAVPASSAPESLVPTAPEAAVVPARLVPISAESPWHSRFAAAADELAAALRTRDESRWRPLLGGAWLGAADADRVEKLLTRRDSPFLHALFSKGRTETAILGWSAPAGMSADERAAIESGPEAEAIVCWSATGAPARTWPAYAAEADNGPQRSYACARIAYSIRDGAPKWRAFIEQGA